MIGIGKPIRDVEMTGFPNIDMEVSDMDFEAIKAAAQGYQADMTRFLRGDDLSPQREL